MTVRNIREIVDKAHTLQLSIKEMSVELDFLKEKIRKHSFETGNAIIKGNFSKVKLGPYTTSFIDPSDLWIKVKKKFDVFKSMVKVDINQASLVLDKTAMFKIIKSETKERHVIRLSFIEPKPKIIGQSINRRTRLIDKEQIQQSSDFEK